MKNKNIELDCNESGVCETPNEEVLKKTEVNGSSKIPKLMYFGDPMCSWCWGISNHLEKVISHFYGHIDFELVMGGLRAGGGDTWNDEMKNFLKGHWQHVNEASGQEFNYELFDRKEFNYDTEPACRAVAIVKSIDSRKAFKFYQNVQYGFYVQNNDPNVLGFYEEVCQKSGVDFKNFTNMFSSDEAKRLVNEDFRKTQNHSISGFPTIVLQSNGKLVAIARGYANFDMMKERIEHLLIDCI